MVADLSSAAFGSAWGNTRSWSNQLQSEYDGPYGVNWFLKEAPMLFQNGTTISVVGVVQKAIWFELVGGAWVPKFYFKDTLVHESGKFIHADTVGKRTEFYDFTVTPALQGKFIRSYDPHGGTAHVIDAGYDGSNRLISITQTVGGNSVRYLYTYHDTSPHENRIQSVTLQVNAVDVRQALFEYYDSGESNGVIGDLKLVTIQTSKIPCPSGSAVWTDVQKTHYRYYTGTSATGYARGLKFVVGPEAYARIVAVGGNPLTATDSTIANYADHYFEFDDTQRVTKEMTNGGLLTFSYSYHTSGNTADYNNWSVRTTETLPDDNQNIVYTNYAGQVMLKVFQSGSDQWYDYYQFDDKGRVTLQAASSAVDSYDEMDAGLVTLRDDAGLIQVTVYYPDDATDPGTAPGYVQYQKVKKGSSGTPITLVENRYDTIDVAGTTTYPLSEQIVYPNEDGTGPISTLFGRTYYSGTQQLNQLTITLPAVPTAQNGADGVTATRIETYSAYGQLLSAEDERGNVTSFSYDLLTGAMKQRIDDAGIGRLNLTTDYANDTLGRITEELGPVHQIDIGGTPTDIRRARWTVYQDDTHEIWRASGYASGGSFGTFTLVQPVSVTRLDSDNRVTAQIQATRASGTSGALDRCDAFAQSSWTRWTQWHFDDHGRQDWQRVYFDIPGSGNGSTGTNYNETQFAYNSMLMLNKVTSPGGTIDKTEYTPMGWISALNTGTDDSGGGGDNMQTVEEREYDGNAAGGDGTLTRVKRYESGGAYRITTYGYDWRNRRTSADGEIDFYESYAYDNLSRLTVTERRDTNAAGALGWSTENKYDTRGHIYQTMQQGSNGSSGNSLTDNFWRDESGNLIRKKQAGSEAFQLMAYDALNRMTVQYVSYGPGDITNDMVMQQSELTYDAASNIILQLSRERFHNATGTGALTSPSGSQPKARVRCVASYPDGLGRIANVANYGTNGASALTRPTTCAARSDTVLVTSTDYNDRGEHWQVTDPEGTVKRATFDNAGRLTQTIENYHSSGSGSDQNKTTDYTYNADGNLATLTAINVATGPQVTAYIYGTTLTDSDVASSRLLRQVAFPDSTGSTDVVEYAYNRLGERKQMKDQQQVVHAYDYDKLGRLIHDRVALPSGSAVDNGVLRVSRTYEFRGMLAKITNYNSATGSTVVNESAFTYNEFGQLSEDEQAHVGPTGSAPSVQYGFANGSANTIRPTTLTYPSGRVLTYDYGTSGGMDDKFSRIFALLDDNSTNTHLAEYLYLGPNRTAQINFAEPGAKFTWIMQSGESPTDGGDQYTGWDRFGRAIDLRWIKNSSGAELERLQHGYDRASNRLYRKNLVASGSDKQDELYAYDELYQLNDFKRGELNSGRTAITGTVANQEEFTFDPTGNWNEYVQFGSGFSIDQTRSYNKANELTEIDSDTTLVAEDAAGNMTTIPQPGHWDAGYDLIYDAWNRLVEVKDGSATIVTYAYDGLHRRTKKVIGSDTRHFYYTDKWQIVEERMNTSTIADRQFVWGIRYIDDLVLRDRGTERLYVIQDYFQPTAVMNTSGTVQERYGYSAFGTTRVMTASFGSRATSSYEWETRFGAYRWDAETGLCQVRNRYLHTGLGRWVNRDPMGDNIEADINLYRYAFNSPTNFVDVDGAHPGIAIGLLILTAVRCILGGLGSVLFDIAFQVSKCCCKQIRAPGPCDFVGCAAQLNLCSVFLSLVIGCLTSVLFPIPFSWSLLGPLVKRAIGKSATSALAKYGC